MDGEAHWAQVVRPSFQFYLFFLLSRSAPRFGSWEPFQPGGGRRARSKHLLGQRQTKGSQQYGPSHVSICARDLSRDETVNSREQRAIC